MESNLQVDQAPPLQSAPSGKQEKAVTRLLVKLRKAKLPQKLRQAGIGIAALALLPIFAGVAYQFAKLRADAHRFPQEGRSVDVGGYTLNINCVGQGSPTVVLEAGLGVPAISWRAVQTEIAKFTRVCSYDRAGYDWSDPGPMPRTFLQNARELHTLLQNAGLKPPYVLVGHSYEGNIVRIYASRYPVEVAGVVLVDTGHEDLKFPKYLQKLLVEENTRRQHDRRWGQLLYWSGISRFEARANIDDPALTYDQQEWNYFQLKPNLKAAAASEMENLEEGNDELTAAGNLGEKPLTVLIAGDITPGLPMSLEEEADVHGLQVDFEKRLASLSTRGKWVIVPGSGHMIPFDRPDAIVNAAKQLCLGTPIS